MRGTLQLVRAQLVSLGTIFLDMVVFWDSKMDPQDCDFLYFIIFFYIKIGNKS
jgi:hypothetical protein